MDTPTTHLVVRDVLFDDHFEIEITESLEKWVYNKCPLGCKFYGNDSEEPKKMCQQLNGKAENLTDVA